MYIIANWKLNKTTEEAVSWVKNFTKALPSDSVNNIGKYRLNVIIAPSSVLIPTVHAEFQNYTQNIFIASQDISMFEEGAHTGEVGLFQLKDFISYSIIGHSERRQNGETIKQVNEKIKLAIKNKITPIVCFSQLNEFNETDKKFHKDILFAYEPIDAISTSGVGIPSDPEAVKEMTEKVGLKSVIYGGSVDKDTIHQYLNKDYINGFLVGGASLDPFSFNAILKAI